jgi:hypothetical protein
MTKYIYFNYLTEYTTSRPPYNAHNTCANFFYGKCDRFILEVSADNYWKYFNW